ncbi:MAG: hypothetical protein IJH47_02100 [Oscillospiraceae bacterium]|nr:hypothetical protein [Oscillospiraceae bacterium]
MLSRTSFFDGTIYKNALRRRWLLGLGYAAALTFRLMTRANIGMDLYRYANMYYPERIESIIQEGLTSVLPMLFAVAMVMAAVGWLYRSRSCAFAASLPLKRQAVFCSDLLGGLTLLLAAPVAAAGLTALLEGTGYGTGMGLLWWLGVTELMTVAYYGFAAFCAVLTGHWLALPALYFILLYAAAALEASVRRILQFLIFGLGNQRWILSFLSPAYYLKNRAYAFIETWTDWQNGIPVDWRVTFHGWPTVIAYAAAGLLFGLAAVLLLRRRRMECAGDVAAEPWLRPVFRIGAAVAASLSVGLLTLQTVFGYSGYSTAAASFSRSMILLLMMLIGAFLGWFCAEMLLRKTVKVFDRSWAGFGILAAVIGALVLGFELDVFGVERAVPDLARVDHAEVSCYSSNVYLTTFSQPENIAAVEELHRHVAASKRIFERENRTSFSGGTLEITYYDQNGVVMTRTWTAPGGALAWASRGNAWESGIWASDGNGVWGTQNPALKELEDLMNTAEARAQRNVPTQGLELNALTANFGSIVLRESTLDGYSNYTTIRELAPDEIADLTCNALLPDLRDTTMGYAKLMPEGQITYPVGNVSFYVSFGSFGENGIEDLWWYLDTTVTPDAARTIAWLEKHGIHMDADAMVTRIDEDVMP